MLYTVVLSWLLTFLLFFFLQLPIVGAVLGLVAAAISGLIYPSSHRSGVERRLRQLHQEAFGDAGPFVCEVEVSPVGVWVRQMNTQITHEWESIKGVEEMGDGIDIITRTGGCIVVRDRAFSSPDERRKFIELVQGYVELSSADDSDHDAQLTRG